MINRILEDREKRYLKVLRAVENGSRSVICGKINCPGENKNTKESLKAFDYLLKTLENEILKGEKYEILDGFDGKSIIIGSDMDCRELKAKTVKIEESHPIGRVFDIDVYNAGGIPVSRSEIGMEPRKCIICGENAKVCVRGRTHSYKDTLNVFNKLINDFEVKDEK